MVVKVSLLSGAVTSDGALSIQTNAGTEAIGITTGQVVSLAQNPILSGGTINGVAYLNGSKVLTTDTGLVFDGANYLTTKYFKSSASTNALFDGVYTGTTAGNTLGKLRFYGSGSGVTGDSEVIGYLESGSITSSGLKFGTTLSGTYSDKMTLDSAGNLGLGVTPSAWGSGLKAIELGGSNSYLALNNTAASGYVYWNMWNDGTNNKTKQTGFIGAYGLNTSGSHVWFNGSGTVGTTSSLTQAMTLDASGNLLVGTTSALAKFAVSNGSTTATGIRGDNGQVSITGKNFWSTYTSSGNNNTTAIHYAAYDGTVGSDVFRVYGNGNVVNNNNSYGAISDVKLKENIVDATPKLEKLCQVRVVNYNLKTDPEHKQLGVIAQELEQIFPSMVEESPDSDIDGNDLGTTTKQVKYSVFVPMLIKAMQELKAEFDAYKAAHP